MKDSASRASGLSHARAVRLLEGQRGLGAGLIAVVGLAGATVLDRVVSMPSLYARPYDLVLHASAELVAGAFAWIVAWALLAVCLRLTSAPSIRGTQRRAARATVTALFGTTLGVVACDVVPRHSAYWHSAPPALWWTGSIAAGVALSFGLFFLLARPVGPRARFIGAGLVVSALGLEVWSLHHELQRYGNLLALVQCVSPVVAGVGATLVVPETRAVSTAGRAAAGLCGLCIVLLGLVEPSYSARRAVLVSGATAKQIVLRCLWPAADRDGDGAPARFWGRDPDDTNPNITPLSSTERVTDRTLEPRASEAGSAPLRNLLWIVVDTVRADTFEQELASDPVLKSGFASFAFHAGYSSCSSRTYLVLAQLLDGFRCDARKLAGSEGRSLLAMLRSQGFHDEIYTYYAPTVSFARSLRIADDRNLLATVARALAEPRPELRALFVHLKGGHGEYEAPGATTRDRYENQLHRSLRAVSELAARAPPEKWAVVVVGDHGEAFGEHGTVAHATTLYEEALRTPLLLRAPNVEPGRTDERLGCSDVAWRALHAVGVLREPPAALPEQYALLDFSRAPGGRAQRDSIRSLRRGAWKVLWRPQLGIWELYDLEHDPRELSSLTETRPREFAALRSDLMRLSGACAVPPLGIASVSSSSTL